MAEALVKKRFKRPTEAQMIAYEAKLLRKLMRSTKSQRLRRMRRLRLTDSTRLVAAQACHS